MKFHARILAHEVDIDVRGSFRQYLSRISCGTSALRVQKVTDFLLRIVVCKLIGQYKENQADTHIVALHGTGWLIAKDLVVTAGHVIYDSKDQWGGLHSMKVFIGYNGNDHSNLESRYGKFVAAPTEWIKDSIPKYDVGFVSFLFPKRLLETVDLLKPDP